MTTGTTFQARSILAISLLSAVVAWTPNHYCDSVQTNCRRGSIRLSPSTGSKQLDWTCQDHNQHKSTRHGLRGVPVPLESLARRNIHLHKHEAATEGKEHYNGDDQNKKKALGDRIKGYFLQIKNGDGDEMTFKQRLAKMGVATVLSYGMISNLSYSILIAAAWYGFASQTGKSPLATGQWKPFLGVYAGFWVFNNVIRPLRLGLSIAVAPWLDKLVLFFQNRLKISKALAITVAVIVVNVVGTTLLMAGGISLAALLAGVPIFPPN